VERDELLHLGGQALGEQLAVHQGGGHDERAEGRREPDSDEKEGDASDG
jgi:hypothetical protein